MAGGDAEAVKRVFGRCLMLCPSVDLWFMYLKFVKRVSGGSYWCVAVGKGRGGVTPDGK